MSKTKIYRTASSTLYRRTLEEGETFSIAPDINKPSEVLPQTQVFGVSRGSVLISDSRMSATLYAGVNPATKTESTVDNSDPVVISCVDAAGADYFCFHAEGYEVPSIYYLNKEITFNILGKAKLAVIEGTLWLDNNSYDKNSIIDKQSTELLTFQSKADGVVVAVLTQV